MSHETDPARNFVAVTKSDDSANNFPACRALYIGTAGDAVVVRKDGTAITFKGLQAGTILPVYAVRVNSTSSTAADIVALY